MNPSPADLRAAASNASRLASYVEPEPTRLESDECDFAGYPPVCLTRATLKRAVVDLTRIKNHSAALNDAFHKACEALANHHCTPAGGEAHTALRADATSDQGRLAPAGDRVTPEDIDAAISTLIAKARALHGGGCDALVWMRAAEKRLRDLIEDYADQRRPKSFRDRLEATNG